MGIVVKNWGKEIVGDNKIKQDLTLTDKSKECIILSLWGDEYNNVNFEEIPSILKKSQ